MFIDKETSDDPGQRPEENFVQPFSNDEPVKMTLIGTRRAIERMIDLLHRHKYRVRLVRSTIRTRQLDRKIEE